MHAGEIETSLLLHLSPHLVGDGYRDADHLADRPDLLLLGMRGYTTSGVIGQPSLATADKGKAILDSLSATFARTLRLLQRVDATE
jgi:creatinine amidohydrolase